MENRRSILKPWQKATGLAAAVLFIWAQAAWAGIIKVDSLRPISAEERKQSGVKISRRGFLKITGASVAGAAIGVKAAASEQEAENPAGAMKGYSGRRLPNGKRVVISEIIWDSNRIVDPEVYFSKRAQCGVTKIYLDPYASGGGDKSNAAKLVALGNFANIVDTAHKYKIQVVLLAGNRASDASWTQNPQLAERHVQALINTVKMLAAGNIGIEGFAFDIEPYTYYEGQTDEETDRNWQAAAGFEAQRLSMLSAYITKLIRNTGFRGEVTFFAKFDFYKPLAGFPINVMSYRRDVTGRGSVEEITEPVRKDKMVKDFAIGMDTGPVKAAGGAHVSFRGREKDMVKAAGEIIDRFGKEKGWRGEIFINTAPDNQDTLWDNFGAAAPKPPQSPKRVTGRQAAEQLRQKVIELGEKLGRKNEAQEWVKGKTIKQLKEKIDELNKLIEKRKGAGILPGAVILGRVSDEQARQLLLPRAVSVVCYSELSQDDPRVDIEVKSTTLDELAETKRTLSLALASTQI